MATRKDEKDRRRQERLAEEQHEKDQARRRLIFGYVAAGILTAAVVAGIVVVIASSGGGGGSSSGGNAALNLASGSQNDVALDEREGTPPPPVQQANLQVAAKAADCDLRLNLPDEGNTHIAPNAPTPNYHTNPPTSGNHVQPPYQQADGAYSEMPGPIFFVHSLEHGRIEIQYSPDLPEQDQLALKGVFDESPAGMLMFPNKDMPYEVAATAWTQLMGCKKYEGAKTLDAIRDFRDQFRGHGPEPVPINPTG
jgi:hypothetical protein